MENLEDEEKIENIFMKNEKYILVYTPPKVGSTTLVSSLRISLKDEYKIIHIHDEDMLKVLYGIKNVKITEIIKKMSEKGKEVYVIDIYRDPIERKMSEYFEKIGSLHFNDVDENIINYPMEKIIDRFNNLFEHIGEGDYYNEIYEITPNAFDFEKKYILQKEKNINYVKLRLSDVNEWGKILFEIFKREIFILTDYQTENKKIGELYKKFKEVYEIPLNYLEKIEKSEELRRYKTELERENYLKKIKKSKKEKIGYRKEEYVFYKKVSIENQKIVKIEKDHYIDNNCKCILCSKKREIIYKKIKKGEKIKSKSIHEENKKEYMKEMEKKMSRIIKPKKDFKMNIIYKK